MNTITEVKQTSKLNVVDITFTDGTTSPHIIDAHVRKHTPDYNTFIANGGVIAPLFSDAEIASWATMRADRDAARLAARNTPKFINETRIKGINRKAKNAIIALIPGATNDNFLTKEMNLLFDNAKLDNIVIKGGTLTVDQQAQKDAFDVLGIAIDAIRVSSDLATDNGTLAADYIP